MKTETIKHYYIYAVCKNEYGRFCEKKLSNLDDKRLTLISIPNKKMFNSEYFYTSQGDKISFTGYTQFIYNRTYFNYLTNMKSSIKTIITFKTLLKIQIYAKYVGQYLRISAIEQNNRVNIPFGKSDDLINMFGIKSNENYLISGNIYLLGNINIINRPTFNDPSLLFGLPKIYNNYFSSIEVNYDNLGVQKTFDENVFNFYHFNERDENYFPLKYPEYNRFDFFVNKSNQNPSNIIINVQENLYFLYLNFTADNILNDGSNITFKCSQKRIIKGEIILSSKMTIIFDGNFDLSELYITTNVDWEKNCAGYLSFLNTLKYPKVDIDIEKENGKNRQSIKLILSGRPDLNLLKTIDPISHNKYLVNLDTIHCIKPNNDFSNKDTFCIYKKNRASCIYVNESLEALSDENLKVFSSSSEKITFYIAENITFTEDTLQSFFETKQDSRLSLIIIAGDSNIEIYGIIKCPMNLNLSFYDSNKINIKNLKIEKSISFNEIFNSKRIGCIDLMRNNIKSLEVHVYDVPDNLKFKRSTYTLLLNNCNQQNITFYSNYFLTRYLNISFDLQFYDEKYYIHTSSDIIFDFSNEFYFYENDTKNYNDRVLFQNKDISKIYNYIDKNNKNLTLIFLQDANINLDLFNFKEIKNVYINCIDSNVNLSGNIRIPEGTIAYIKNFSIEKLILNVDINISNGITSFYDISQSIGTPSVNIYPHLLPTNIQECKSKKIKIKILQTDKKLIFNISKLIFPMNGGYINQIAEFNDTESNNYSLNVIYTFIEIHLNPNHNNHFCLYQNNSSLCLENSKKINNNEFCLGDFDNNISNYYIFNVIENITFNSPCNLQSMNGKKFITFIGDHYIKGNITLTENIDLVILSKNVISELQIEINAVMNNDEIEVPSIYTFEEATPKSLIVNIPYYPQELELSMPESRQFLRGICMETINHFPNPYNKDFRVKSVCSNVDGIFGMKIKCLIQKYKNNHFCFYETSINKCIFNDQLESYQPIKYSEIPPLFVKDESNPSLYFYDSPSDIFDFSFQYALTLKYNTAKIVNNDNAKLRVFIPSNFKIFGIGNYSNSNFSFQFDFNENDNSINYGSLSLDEINYSINLHPIPLNHNSFIYTDTITLNENEAIFAVNTNQQGIRKYSIKYENNLMETNMKSEFEKFEEKDEECDLTKIYGNVFHSDYFVFSLSNSQTIKLNDVGNNKYIIIQSTTDNTLTFDMSGVDGSASKDHIFFLINEMKINFTNIEDIDFKDYNIIFHNCNLYPLWINKIKGKNLFFDSKSYYSFYNEPNKIVAFNGDKIQINQKYTYLRNDKYLTKNITFIQLNAYHVFYDNIGEDINFIGTDSIFSIGYIQNSTKLSFNNFSHLTIISENVSEFISLYNVTNCIIQSSTKNEFNSLNTIEITENYQTKLKSNGKINVKKLLINSNYDAFSINRIENVEITENTNAIIQNGNFLTSIIINNNSSLILNSCNSSEKIKIFIHGIIYEDPRLNLEYNNKIKFESLMINLTNQDLPKTAVVIKGIEKKECKNLKNKFAIFDIDDDITKNYNIKCDSKKSFLLINKKQSMWKIIEILVILVCSLIILSAIIILIVFLIKKRCCCRGNYEKTTTNETCLMTDFNFNF